VSAFLNLNLGQVIGGMHASAINADRIHHTAAAWLTDLNVMLREFVPEVRDII